MESPQNLLQQAIQAARAGRKEEARDLLVQLVEAEPRNEMAWIWLTGLVDTLEDKIIACENVLTINPSNERVRAYLNQLLAAQGHLLSAQEQLIAEQKKQEEELKSSPGSAAPFTPLSFEEHEPPSGIGEAGRSERPYLNVIETRDEIRAIEYPRSSLSPMELAKHLETEGELEEALQVLTELAGETKDRVQFDRIYGEITRLESLRAEKIAHIAPSTNILRMSFSWPLVYLTLSLMQMGMNPFARDSWYLWLGLPIVAVGSFLLALAEVRSRHTVWRTVFSEETAEGSSMARTSASIGGWLLVIMPHLLLLVEGLSRLQEFRPSSIPLQ